MFSEGALNSTVSLKQSFILFSIYKTKLHKEHIFHLVLYQQVENLIHVDLSSDVDLSLLAVRKEDIFLQFISEAKISEDLAQINLGMP